MSNAKIAKLHTKVFSTPQFSKERERAISALSEADRAAVFNLERDYMAGRITREQIAEMAQKEGETMTYQEFKEKTDSGTKGVLQEISKFAMESPEVYQQYRERYHREQDEAQQRHNRRLTEATFTNKPYSFR
ncbi:hypothetical protein IMSAG185_01481 [Lachnospiraceae bacterium]|nr:hypothetical protein IMSAG185_01481 [Lachnospiraceae bacterium]